MKYTIAKPSNLLVRMPEQEQEQKLDICPPTEEDIKSVS
jgi:hypothetical protein